MEPLTISAIATIIGGLAQAYTAEQARGASQEKLDQIAEMYNNIKPPEYDVSIDAPPQLQKQALASPMFAQAVQAPSFDMSKFTPEKLKVIGTYSPQLAPLIKEVAPTLIQKTADMGTGRQAQLDALKKFSQVGAGGFDPEYAQKVQKASEATQQEAQGRQGALADSFARRGLGGSGLELAANMAGNAQGMNRLAGENQAAAASSYQNQLNALAQAAGIGSNIQNQDQSLQSQNAGIINSFNQRMSTAAQNQANNSAEMMNQAAMRNLSEGQRVADTNVNNANTAAVSERNRGDELAKFGYGAQMDAAKMQNQNAQNTFQNQVGERNNQNSVATTLAQWAADQKAKQNQLKSQTYNNQMGNAAANAGMYRDQSNTLLGQAADRNQAISGVTGAINTGALAYQNSVDKTEDRKMKQKMLDQYGYTGGASAF